MTRQLCCRGMCKNLLRSDGQQWNYSKAKFPSSLNCGKKIVRETGPWAVNWYQLCWVRVSPASNMWLHAIINLIMGAINKGHINTLRPRQNGRHFTDDTFKRIFLNEDVGILIKISLKFVPKGPINNIPALVQVMAWHRPGDKPLTEPMVVRLLTHICVTRSQWVNSFIPSLSPRPTVANSCTNQCEWHRLQMEAIFSLKIWGSYRVYLYAEPERFDTKIICESHTN